MLRIVPYCIDDFITTIGNFRYGELNTRKNAKQFFTATLNTAIAAGICMAAYKRSMVAMAAGAALSVPATVMAAGVLAMRYSFTALKAGIVQRDIFQALLAPVALYAGWHLLDSYKNFQGFFQALPNPASIDHECKVPKKNKPAYRPLNNLAGRLAMFCGYLPKNT